VRGRPPRPIEQMYVVADDGCWIWTAAVNGSGYPNVSREGRSWLAHRYLYHSQVGPIPEDCDVRHTCSNVMCVNPEHLTLARRSAA